MHLYTLTMLMSASTKKCPMLTTPHNGVSIKILRGRSSTLHGQIQAYPPIQPSNGGYTAMIQEGSGTTRILRAF